MQQGYDGDGLRVKKREQGYDTYYVRSSVLGHQVVAELSFVNHSWSWRRGYVYLGGQLLALQQNSAVTWVHADPVLKSQRVTDFAGDITASLELDAWGGETSRSVNSNQQPSKFTTYDRDLSGNDQAMLRQYHPYWMRFDQPDPYGGSYDVTDPQSFNRYSYTQNDPVNFVDPSGLLIAEARCTVVWVFRPDAEGGHYILREECGYEFYGGDTGRRDPPGIDVSGGGEGITQAQPPNQKNPMPLHCLGNVIKVMEKAWKAASPADDRARREAGFTLFTGPNGKSLQFSEVVVSQTEKEVQTPLIPGHMAAIFHTHGVGRGPMPSEGDRAVANGNPVNGVPTGDRFPVYVMSKQGLYVYNPGAKEPELLRKNVTDWKKGCPP